MTAKSTGRKKLIKIDTRVSNTIAQIDIASSFDLRVTIEDTGGNRVEMIVNDLRNFLIIQLGNEDEV